ncbi:hypothetical protein [Planctopirus ephydatiae]|uniref:hypothetical protein n=1 Tax=Planctopirus ephydatiae TaxID=2528019 RepID=UPI0011A89692|nr:hypothetical protein [Planctopirus ephydatiae]
MVRKLIDKSKYLGVSKEPQLPEFGSVFRRLWLSSSERRTLDREPSLSQGATFDESRAIDRQLRDSQKFMVSKCGEIFVSEVSELLDYYLWCLGQDIRTEGNLLLQAGGRKNPCPRPHPCGSRYEWNSGENLLVLWGFGVCFGNPQSGRVMLRRLGFAPLLMVDSRRIDFGWSIEELPPQRTATEGEWSALKTLLGRLFVTLAELEKSILSQALPTHREDCLSKWDKRKYSTPLEPGQEWLRRDMTLQSIE